MRLFLMQSGTQGAASSDLQREIQQTIQDAQRAAQDAAKEAQKALQNARDAAPQAAQAPAAPGTIVFPGENGENIRINVDGKGINVCQQESCTTIPIHDVVPRGAVLMTYAVFGSLAFMVVGYPLARAFARWLDRRGQSVGPSRELQARLDAMERNIDAAAVEIERVGEGQRFTNRLLEQRPVEHAQRSDR